AKIASRSARACFNKASFSLVRRAISSLTASAFVKADSIEFSRSLTAAKMGFQAYFPRINRRIKKDNDVQNIKPTSGFTKSIIFFVLLVLIIIFKHARSQPLRAVFFFAA